MTQLRRVQAFGFFGILFVELIYILLIKPYAKKPFLTLQVITHVMISGIFFYIDYLDNKGETDAKAIYQSGWILIGIAGGVGLFNLLYLMVCSLYPILRLFKNEKIERVHSASSTIEADDPKKAIDSKAAFSKDIKPDDSTLEKKLDDKSGADASKGGTKSENKEPELPIPKEIITVPKEEPKTADLKKTESIPKSDKESPDKKRSKLEEDKWESLSKKESLTKKEPIINKESLNKNESMKKIESVTKLPENSNRDEAGVTPNKDELKPSQSEKKLEHHSSVLSFNPNKNTSKKNTILPEEEGKKAPFSQEEEEAIKNIDKSHLDTSKEEVEQNSIMYLLPENNPASSYYPGSDKASFNSSSRQTGYYPFAPIRKPFREELDLSRIIVKNPKDPKNLNLEVKKDDHVIDILEDFSSKRVHNKYLDSGREPEFLAPPGWDDLSEASDQRAKKIIPPTVYDNIIPKFEENPIIKENPAKRRRKFSNSTVTDGEAYKSNNAINL